MALQDVGARLVVENLAGYTTALGSAQRSMSGLRDETDRASLASRAFQASAVVVAAGAAAIAAGLGASIVAAVGFEAKMSGVKAVSGATGEEMKQLSALALQLGKDTSFSASEAAAGIEELVKGGVSVADIMGGAALASLNLAAAGEIDLASAAEIAANAMNQFGLKGSDMAHVSDQIAGAANASSLSVMDFKLSLAQVGAVASVAGQSFDSTATAIAVMGAAGIKGSDAGTSLKQMLLNLQPATDKTRALFDQLGITVRGTNNQFFDAEGHAKSMGEIAGVLQTALAGQTDQQKLANLETLFGSDAMRAAAIITKAGAEGFDTMAASMAKVTAQAVAAERLNNVKGSIEQLKGSLETAAITLGIAFLPMIKAGIDSVTKFVNEGIIPFAEKLGTLGGVIAALGSGTGFDVLYEKINNVFGFDIAKFIDPIAVWARDDLPVLRAEWARIVEAIKPLWERALPAVVKGLGDVVSTGATIIKFFKDTQLAQDALAAGLASYLIVQLGLTAVALYGVATAAVAAAIPLVLLALPFIALGIVIAAVVLAGITIVRNWELIERGAEALGIVVGRLWDGIKEAVSSAIDEVVGRFNGLMGAIQILGDNFAGILGFMVGSAYQFVADAVQAFEAFKAQALQAILDFVLAAPALMGGFVADVVASLTGLADQAPGAVQGAWDGIIAAIGTFATDAAAAIGTFVTGGVQALTDGVGQFVQVGSDLIAGVVRGIVNGIPNALGAIGNAAREFVIGFKAALKEGSPSRLMAEEVGIPIMQGIAAGIEEGAGLVTAAITTSLAPGIAAAVAGSTAAAAAFDLWRDHLKAFVAEGKLAEIAQGFLDMGATAAQAQDATQKLFDEVQADSKRAAEVATKAAVDFADAWVRAQSIAAQQQAASVAGNTAQILSNQALVNKIVEMNGFLTTDATKVAAAMAALSQQAAADEVEHWKQVTNAFGFAITSAQELSVAMQEISIDARNAMQDAADASANAARLASLNNVQQQLGSINTAVDIAKFSGITVDAKFIMDALLTAFADGGNWLAGNVSSGLRSDRVAEMLANYNALLQAAASLGSTWGFTLEQLRAEAVAMFTGGGSSFAAGGIIRGALGTPTTVMAHAGELILNLSQQQGLAEAIAGIYNMGGTRSTGPDVVMLPIGERLRGEERPAVNYTVNATYSRTQDEGSVRLDMEAISLLAMR